MSNFPRSRSSSERRSIVCNIKVDPLKMSKIKKEIHHKYYETGWKEEYQDDSRLDDSVTTNDPDNEYDVIHMDEGDNDEHEESKLIDLLFCFIQMYFHSKDRFRITAAKHMKNIIWKKKYRCH